LKVNSTLPVYIDLPNSNVYLKVEDSACYDIRLPGGKETDLKRKLFPLTEKEKIPAFIVDEPNGLNFNLLKLNNMLFDMQKYLVFVQDLEKRKKLYDSLIVYLDTLRAKGNIEYFENYKKYRLAKVHQDLFHLKREFYFDSLFAYKPFLYNIPSYLDFFKSYYSNYLLSGIISGDTLIQLIFKYDFKTIVEKIENANQNKLTKEVAQMIAIYNLYQIYYRTKDFQPAIIQMFANLQTSNKLNSVQKKIVKDIYLKFTSLRKGYYAPHFNLPNYKNKNFENEDFKGDFVYLNFYSPYCNTCSGYMEMLAKYYKQKIKKLNIVTIFVADSISQMNDFLEQNKEYKWTFLFANYKNDILKEYNIKSFPTFYLFNPDGKFAIENCPSPIENFEKAYNNAYKEWMKEKKEIQQLH